MTPNPLGFITLAPYEGQTDERNTFQSCMLQARRVFGVASA